MHAQPRAAPDPRLPGGQGRPLLPGRRGRALQPAPAPPLRRPRGDPGHAAGGGRDGRRRRARADHGQGGRGGRPAAHRPRRDRDRTRRSTRSGCGTSPSGWPTSWRRRWRGVAAPIAGLPRPRTSTTWSCSAWVAAASPATCSPRWPSRSSPVPVLVVKDSALPGFVGPRTLVVAAVVLRRDGRDAGRGERGAGAGRAASWRCRPGARWPRWPRMAGGVALAVDGDASRCLEPPSARWWRRCWRWPRTSGVLPGARAQVAAAVGQLRRRAAALSPARQRRRSALARTDRAHVAARLRRRAARRAWPRRAGRTRSTRTPRRRPSPTPCPRCATTSCAAGASTATSPARCSR